MPGKVPQWVDRLLEDGPRDPVSENVQDSEQSLSTPDENQTGDDQPAVVVTPCYSLRDRSTIGPPARLVTTAQDELLHGGCDVPLLALNSTRLL